MKTALITGAYGGIGSAISRALGSGKFHVIASGNNETKLEDLQKEIGEEKCSIFVCDFSSYDEIVSLKKKVAEKFESIDWVINSVGFVDLNLDFESQKPGDMEQTFKTNTFSSIYLVQQFTPLIKEGGGFIHISSMAGIQGNGKWAVYSASKAAVNNFAQAMARRYPDIISISVCPGATNTALREALAHDAAKHQSPEAVAKVIKKIALNEGEYKSGDIITVRDNTETIYSRLDS